MCEKIVRFSPPLYTPVTLRDRAIKILRGKNKDCTCGAPTEGYDNHSPDCNYERAVEDAWLQAVDEAYDEKGD